MGHGPSAVERDRAAALAAWSAVEKHLTEVRRSVLAEIRSYPRPIAGCDQQFNFLLERSWRVSDELARLAATRDPDALIGFISASPCIDQAFRARLLSALNAAAPAPAPS